MLKKWLILGFGFIFLMTLIFYLPAIRGGYIWDDDAYVTNNLTLRTLDGLRRIWLEIGAVPQYYPLVHTSFWVEYHLWQLHPLGYHMVNVLLHALNAILLWLVLRRLGIAGAWLAATIFALHPVHVESVVWITERKNVLSSFFYLSAVLIYLRFLRWDRGLYNTSSQSTKHSSALVAIRYHWGYYTLALGLYICALLSKTVTCTMPAAILLLWWWQRGRICWRTVSPLIPYFLVGATLALTTVWIEKHHVGAEGEEWTLSLVERCLIAGRALWFYAGKLFWPHKLTFIYPRWQIDARIWWQYLFPLAAVVVFIALWLFRRQIGKAPLVAVLFFAGTLAPALGFFDVYPMRYSFVADHFQYLASIGLIVLFIAVITTIFWRLGPLHRTIGGAACGVMILMLGMLVWQQGHIYRDAEKLWRDTISKNPNAWMAYTNLGNLLSRKGKFDEAIKYHKKAIAIKPHYAKGHTNIGLVYYKKGMLDRAVAEHKKALTINPNFAEAHTYLGLAYEKKGMLDRAVAEHKKALTINPNFAEAHNNLGVSYHKKGMVDRAISEYKKTLIINPEYAEAHTNLGLAYTGKGMLDKAISEHKKALIIKPNLAKAHLSLGLAYYKKGMLDEAISGYKKALSFKPNFAMAYYNLSVAYYDKGNYKLAIVYCDKAVELGYRIRSQFSRNLEPYR